MSVIVFSNNNYGYKTETKLTKKINLNYLSEALKSHYIMASTSL